MAVYDSADDLGAAVTIPEIAVRARSASPKRLPSYACDKPPPIRSLRGDSPGRVSSSPCDIRTGLRKKSILPGAAQGIS